MRKVGTQYSYQPIRSNFSKRYFYILELEKDDFGETKRTITKSLTQGELSKLKDDIIKLLTI